MHLAMTKDFNEKLGCPGFVEKKDLKITSKLATRKSEFEKHVHFIDNLLFYRYNFTSCSLFLLLPRTLVQEL